MYVDIFTKILMISDALQYRPVSKLYKFSFGVAQLPWSTSCTTTLLVVVWLLQGKSRVAGALLCSIEYVVQGHKNLGMYM